MIQVWYKLRANTRLGSHFPIAIHDIFYKIDQNQHDICVGLLESIWSNRTSKQRNTLTQRQQRFFFRSAFKKNWQWKGENKKWSCISSWASPSRFILLRQRHQLGCSSANPTAFSLRQSEKVGGLPVTDEVSLGDAVWVCERPGT